VGGGGGLAAVCQTIILVNREDGPLKGQSNRSKKRKRGLVLGKSFFHPRKKKTSPHTEVGGGGGGSGWGGGGGGGWGGGGVFFGGWRWLGVCGGGWGVAGGLVWVVWGGGKQGLKKFYSF